MPDAAVETEPDFPVTQTTLTKPVPGFRRRAACHLSFMSAPGVFAAREVRSWRTAGKRHGVGRIFFVGEGLAVARLPVASRVEMRREGARKCVFRG